MRGRHLYKYFTERKWAEAFLDGSLLFRSLAYYRDYEDEEIRGDVNEGTAIIRPGGGLRGRNFTQRRNFVLPDSAFESGANAGEIFVYCLSKSQDEEKRERFRASVCVEIVDAKAFCRRVERALPNRVTFGGRPGHRKIGQHIQYYTITESGGPRWALPDLIASSKLDSYAWQDEFRLVFSLTDALDFDKVSVRIVHGLVRRIPNPTEHHSYDLRLVAPLRDIAFLHDLSVPLSA